MKVLKLLTIERLIQVTLEPHGYEWMYIYSLICGLISTSAVGPSSLQLSHLQIQPTVGQKNHFHIPSYVFPTTDQKHCFWFADGWTLDGKNQLWSPVIRAFSAVLGAGPLCCARIKSAVNSCHICAIWLLNYTVEWWFPEEQDIYENGRKGEKIFKDLNSEAKLEQESSNPQEKMTI